jgi:hypothetical protein
VTQQGKPPDTQAQETPEESPEEGATLMLDSASLEAQLAQRRLESPLEEEEADSGATVMLNSAEIAAQIAKRQSEAQPPANQAAPEAGTAPMLDAAELAAQIARRQSEAQSAAPNAEEEPDAGSTLILDSAKAAAQLSENQKEALPAAQAEEEDESGSTLILDSAKAAALLSKKQPAASPAPESEEEPEAGATLMLDAAAVAAATKARLGDASNQDATLPGSPPVAPQAGAYSRRNSGEHKIKVEKRAERPEGLPEPAATVDPAIGRRLALAATIGVGAIGLILFMQSINSGSRPSNDELMLLYPYGIVDSTEPGGRHVPGALKVRFSYEGTKLCEPKSEVECLEYRYYKDDFSGTMLIKQTAQGWQRFEAEPAHTAG